MTNCNILMLQETLLPNHAIENIDRLLGEMLDFVEYYFVPAVRDEDCFCGRSKGGLAMIWNKMVSPYVTTRTFTDRIGGLSISVNNVRILLLNIYMPCDYRNSDSLFEFRSVIEDIRNIFNDELQDYDEIVFAGDWNADPFKGRFYNELKDFIKDISFIIVDVCELPSTSHTYISCNETASVSWLDHVIARDSTIVSDIEIMMGTTFHDHILMKFQLNVAFPNLNGLNREVEGTKASFIPWNKLSQLDILIYRDNLVMICSEYFPDIFDCRSNFCGCNDHKFKLIEIYDFVTCAILTASNHIIKCKQANYKKSVPGWNFHCRELHDIARQCYLNWNNAGKPRDCPLFEDMKSSRTRFKNALNYCQKNELLIRKQNLYNKFVRNNKCSYWKEIRALGGTRCGKMSSCIDGLSDANDVVSLFDEKYKRILDSPTSQTLPVGFDDFLAGLHRNEQLNSCKIFQHDIDDAINSLRDALGWDDIHSNHLKYSGPCFRLFLSRVFSSFITHCYVPQQLVRGEIRPILKDRTGNKSSSDNYRPIMNSSNLFKSFEYCLLPHLKMNLKINSRQFAYRPHVGCITATTLLKETVNKYVNENSVVHCCMVDLKKAYDKLNVNILLLKLGKTDLPPLITLTLKSIFDNFYVCVKYNNTCSINDWKVKNGVRQGGICSGLLFSFYVDEILCTLSELSIGCKINFYRINIIAYADDVALLSPSANGLQFLIDKLILFFDSLCLNINVNKTKYIVFGNRKMLRPGWKMYMYGEQIERVSSCKYLGIILDEDMSIKSDVKRCCKSFLAQFNSMYYKFNFLDRSQIIFLFNSFCKSFYGSELWSSNLNKRGSFDSISVAYHNALKKILNLSKWHNNHLAAEMSNMLLFKHFLSEKIVCHFISIVRNPSPCLRELKTYLLYKSSMSLHVRNHFMNVYSINNILLQPLCAIKARIKYVQRNEQSSGYIPMFLQN